MNLNVTRVASDSGTTPDAQARAKSRADYKFMTESYAELWRMIDADPAPIPRSRAWTQHRQRITARGGEATHVQGAGATYHLDDVARFLDGAADMMATGSTLLGIPRGKHPRRALAYVAEGHGYRYRRGVQGLDDALAAACPGLLGPFRGERVDFDAEFRERAHAAYVTNEDGECPAAVVKVLQLLADELRCLAGWLDRGGLAAHGQHLVRRVEEAEGLLDEWRAAQEPAPRQPQRRGRRR